VPRARISGFRARLEEKPWTSTIGVVSSSGSPPLPFQPLNPFDPLAPFEDCRFREVGTRTKTRLEPAWVHPP
jgi:hypothetical protein